MVPTGPRRSCSRASRPSRRPPAGRRPRAEPPAVIVLVAVASVFVLAALTPVTVRLFGREAGYLNAAVLLALGVALARHAPEVLEGDAVAASVAWLPQLGIELSLRMDALGLLFAAIVLGIGAAVMAYGARYFGADERAKASRYLSLLTLFAGAMLGLVLADDAIALFVFWELTSISSFFLIGGKGEGGAGATRAFLTTGLGGLSLLAGVVLLSVAAGTTSLSAMAADPSAILGSPVAAPAAVLVLIAVATKSAQMPFHFWLPGAMVAPTPVSTYLHAATMVKAGIYLLFRTTGILAEVPLWTPTLVLLGGATAVYAAITAVKQDDLKGLLAYSTISQLGLLTLTIGLATPLALAAAALHTLAHALFKATLFMTVGIVDHETGTRKLSELGGLARTLRTTALAGGLAAVSMAGLPPLLGFVSKEEVLAATLEVHGAAWLAPTATTLAVVASIGTFAYSGRYLLGTFFGPVRTPAHRAPTGFAAPALVTAGLGLLLAVVVPLLDPLVNGVAAATTGEDPHLHLALWHGITGPLLLSLLIATVGGALVARRHAVERFQQRRQLVPDGAGLFDGVYDAVLRLGAQVGRPARSDRPSTYLVPILASAVVAAVAVTSVADLGALGPPAPSQAGDLVVIVLLAGCILGVVQARSRLAATAALGLAGFTVAIWFVLLGAPDLALTQLLIETLMVTLIVLVFRRLPSTFQRGGAVRKGLAATAAVAVGAATTAGAYLFLGRRELSEVGQRFLDEGEGLTGGGNVVNTILVDFRALDTLGEITVLAVAAAGIVALVRMVATRPVPRPSAPGQSLDADTEEPSETSDRWGGRGMMDTVVMRTAAAALAPIMVLASLWLLVRGHDAVGGGFIGGLTAGAAVVLLYFARGHERIWRSRFLRTLPLVGSGVLVAALHGFLMLAVEGSYLAGAKVHLPFGIHVAASLLFDIGVFLVVVGLVVAVLRHLGQGEAEDPADPRRTPARTGAEVRS
ncbi:DUF4040 domain-containing protein [Nitriliruptoraceae bacterium ZYF776]|nr:DUF4040 domain-containing protein [Profundirhabdus halotolerans]